MVSRAKSRAKHLSVDWVAVGRRIREMRGFDMTQEEFAKRVGISQNYLSTIERGKVEIGAEILLRICQEFAKSVEWLLTGEGGQSRI
jgi:transcriptional regulator with XRE-family HTH domain